MGDRELVISLACILIADFKGVSGPEGCLSQVSRKKPTAQGNGGFSQRLGDHRPPRLTVSTQQTASALDAQGELDLMPLFELG